MKHLSVTQMVIPCLAAIVGLVVLALGAEIMAFTTYYFKADTAHKHNDDMRFQYEITLEHDGYDPWNLPYTRPALLVAVGTITFLLNVVVAALLIRRRTPAMLVLCIDVVLLLLALAATIYAWSPSFDPITAHHYRRPMVYAPKDGPAVWLWHHKDTIFDPVNWFCALWPAIPRGSTSYDETVLACQEGNALIDLMIVIVLMQAIVLVVHVWGFNSAKKVQKKIDEKVAEDSD